MLKFDDGIKSQYDIALPLRRFKYKVIFLFMEVYLQVNQIYLRYIDFLD